MNDKVKKSLKELMSDKKLLVLLGLGLLGMVLLLFSGTGEKKTAAASGDYGNSQAESEIEQRLSELLRSVEGAGKVNVMVTVDCLYEKTVAINTESESGENKSAYSSEYVLIEQSGDSDGMVLKVTSPVIRGVGITCQGGDNPTVRQEIIRLISATLGISVNRIWVTTMKD